MREIAREFLTLGATAYGGPAIIGIMQAELQTELADGRKVTLTPGTSYQVADGAEAHRSSTPSGAKLFVVD